MATATKAEVKALGFTKDDTKVALRFEGEDGAPLIIEFPIAGLQGLGLLAAQVPEIHAKRRGSTYRPHSLPVWKYEAGADRGNDIVVLALHLQGGGMHVFHFDKKFALGLQQGLAEAIDLSAQQRTH